MHALHSCAAGRIQYPLHVSQRLCRARSHPVCAHRVCLYVHGQRVLELAKPASTSAQSPPSRCWNRAMHGAERSRVQSALRGLLVQNHL